MAIFFKFFQFRVDFDITIFLKSVQRVMFNFFAIKESSDFLSSARIQWDPVLVSIGTQIPLDSS